MSSPCAKHLLMLADTRSADVFDGAMVTLGFYILNFMHPGRLLLATRQTNSYTMTGRTPSY